MCEFSEAERVTWKKLALDMARRRNNASRKLSQRQVM